MSAHVTRIVKILTKLSGGRSLTPSEIVDQLHDERELKQVSLRQIQRDLNNIESAGVPLVVTSDGKEQRWSLPSSYRSLAPLTISKNEIVSLHILKGALGALQNTRVQKDLVRLKAKLESYAPGDVFMDESLISDVSPGRYMNAIDDDALEQIIFAITDPQWDRVTYRSVSAGTTKTFVVSFCRLVNHSGRLYVIAWHEKYQQYITLAADMIEHVEVANDWSTKHHLFDERMYRKQRFGIYDGDAVDVTLRVNKEYAHYFSTRLWHQSQVVKHHKNGTLTITMSVPISPELLSWIMGWARGLRVMKPKSLITACKKIAREVEEW